MVNIISPEAVERFRARGNPRKGSWGSGQGSDPNSHAALRMMLANVIVCRTPGCRLLVQWQKASQAARKQDRDHILPGDGCAVCSRAKTRATTRRPKLRAREAEGQISRILGILSGERMLVRRNRVSDTARAIYTARAENSNENR